MTPVLSQSASETAVPSALEQHGPRPDLRPSNQAFISGLELVNGPRSGAFAKQNGSMTGVTTPPPIAAKRKCLMIPLRLVLAKLRPNRMFDAPLQAYAEFPSIEDMHWPPELAFS